MRLEVIFSNPFALKSHPISTSQTSAILEAQHISQEPHVINLTRQALPQGRNAGGVPWRENHRVAIQAIPHVSQISRNPSNFRAKYINAKKREEKRLKWS